jgi:hypothetical protein
MSNLDALYARAKALNLHGLLAHWTEAATAGWIEALVDWEEQERGRRSLERRLSSAHIGRFKPVCDFDWKWPKRADRPAFEAPDGARLPQGGDQRHPGRSQRRG